MRLPRIEKSKLGRGIKQNSTQAQLPSAAYGSEPHQRRCAPVRLLHLRVSCTFAAQERTPSCSTSALRRRARDLYPFVTSRRTSCSPLPTPLSGTYCSAVMRRSIAPKTRRSCALPPATISSTRSSQTPQIYFVSPRALQCCGAAVASRATGGGVASPVSVLTRGSVRGAPFLTNSVLISTF